MSLKEVLKNNKIDVIENDQEWIQAEEAAIFTYCKIKNFILDEEDMNTIISRGYEDTLCVWKELYENESDHISICVYRDTIESHNEDGNLTNIQVTKAFAEQYFKECHKESSWKSLEDFLSSYTAEDTQDFFKYAVEHNAILGMDSY